jgi:hypothetical protein
VECFCGCGRKIGFWERTANNYGKTAKLLVGKLDELDFDDEPDYQLLRERGREWFDDYAAATHGEIPLKTLSTRDWKQWRKIAYRVVKEADANYSKLGSWAIAEGLTSTQGAEKLAAMSPEERSAFLAAAGASLGLIGPGLVGEHPLTVGILDRLTLIAPPRERFAYGLGVVC